MGYMYRENSLEIRSTLNPIFSPWPMQAFIYQIFAFFFFLFTSMSIVFLPSDVPNHYPKHLLSLTGDSIVVVVVQSLSHVWLFETPWTAARQASLSFTVSRSLFKLMSIESMMPSNHLILCHPFLLLPSIFPSIKVPFPMSWLFTSGGHSIGMSTSASVLPMNIQGRFILG